LAVVPSAALLLASCQEPEPSPQEQPGAAGSVNAPGTGQFVQVAAHPDDDLLFMNPDLAAGIRDHQPTTGIYLTGGESSLPNAAGYISRRQDGTRAAYAWMAGVADTWTRETVPVGDHRAVEVDHLDARPDVRVAFLNLPEDNDPAATGGKHALTRLFNGAPNPITTMVPTGGVVRESLPYTRADVVDALSELFAVLRPTVIRGQDPAPDPRYQPQWGEWHNHPDHVITARFTREAAQRYEQEQASNRASVVHYRDYNVADVPVDLSETDRRRKKDVFAAYVPHDSEANLGGSYRDWTEHSYYRWTRGGSWSGRDGSGRLHAFAVFGGQLVRWTETGGSWRGPEPLPAPEPLRPSLAVLRDGAGRLVLVGQSADGQRVLVNHQTLDGNWSPNWDSAGNPHEGRPDEDLAQTGVPAAGLDRAGRVVVAVKNAAGGLSVRRETAPGTWDRWRDLGGTDVQDRVSVAPDEDDQLHVFASTRDEVQDWRQDDAGSFEPARAPLPGTHPSSPPQAVREPDGRLRVVVRTDDGTFAAADASPSWWPSWLRTPQRLGAPGGTAGPVLAARTGENESGSLVLARTSFGGVSASRSDGSGWTDLGGPVVDQPAAVTEPDGAITLLATGADGRLLVNRAAPGRSGLDFGGWRPAQP
jgi:LmbE family N-acetylglucosaminyl deacetylase